MKKKILIIENDRDIRNIVEFILSQEGFNALSIPEPRRRSKRIEFWHTRMEIRHDARSMR